MFNFNQYPGAIETVTFDFYYEEGALNFAANGAAITILPSLESGLYSIGPDINMDISFTSNSGNQGVATITGNLVTLLIGGDAIRIDNLCINPSCNIENLTVEGRPL